MHYIVTGRSARRSHLLGGGALALAALSDMPAAAQSIDATALRSAINRQVASGSVTADASGTAASANFPAIQSGTVSVADNQLSAAAHANSAATTLAPADLPTGADATPTALSIWQGGVTARADNLVANSQRMMSAPVRATLLGGRASITAAGVSSGDLAVTGNDFEASALGNQASDQLGLDNPISGAGVVSAQTGDASSGVSASNASSAQLAIGTGSGSRLDLGGNTILAKAGGNASDDTLSVNIGAVNVPAGTTPASTVSSAADNISTANALYANLGRQQLAGQVDATAGSASGAFAIAASGNLDASSANAGNNALAATANGNQSSRSLSLTTGSLSGEGAGPIATVTNVQRVTGGVGATTYGGTVIAIAGHLSGGEVSASHNQTIAAATANRADGNLLTADAIAIASGRPAGGAGLPLGTVGTAMTTNDGAASTTAALSVQNVQDAGGGVSASVSGGRTALAVTGAVDHASLTATDNITHAVATGNVATNGATLHAGSLRSSVDLNNAQTVDGSVRVQIGAAGPSLDRAGAVIEAISTIAGSQLRVSGNEIAGAATGSSASNSLTVTGGTVSDGSGHVDATAGTIDGGYGAAADIALANYQKFGTPLLGAPSAAAVTSNVAGKFAIGNVGYTEGATLAVDGNSQSATAIANTALDRLAVTANYMPGGASPAAGTALSSSQFGDGTVGANSDMLVVARGGVDNGAVSMSDNANQAFAAMNDADNGMTIAAVRFDGVTSGPADIDASNLGAATVSGDHVLSATQFAGGTVGAAARTRLINSDALGSISGSTFAIGANSTVADVSANHAVNAVSVTGVSGSGVDAGLANSQMSAATVTASARTDATLGLTGSVQGTAINGSSVTIAANLTQAVARGNSANNALTLNGPGNNGDTGTAHVSTFDTVVSAPAALVNAQSNYGPVTASAAGTTGIPLNAGGGVASSTLAVTGNAMSASAYGNAATNQITIAGAGATPGGVLSNVQTNNGPVSASVMGANYAARGGQFANGTLTMSGNQLAASATGNVASSAITTGR